MRRRSREREQFDGRAELEQRLARSEQTAADLRAELQRLNEQALQIARQFQHEAAVRAEAEGIVETLGNECARLQRELDLLRAAADSEARPSETTPVERSESPEEA